MLGCGISLPELVKKAVVEIYLHGYENDLRKFNNLSNYDYCHLREYLKELKEEGVVDFSQER